MDHHDHFHHTMHDPAAHFQHIHLMHDLAVQLHPPAAFQADMDMRRCKKGNINALENVPPAAFQADMDARRHAAQMHQAAIDADRDSAPAPMQPPAPSRRGRRLRRSVRAPAPRCTRAAKLVALALVCALLGIGVVYGGIVIALLRQQF